LEKNSWVWIEHQNPFYDIGRKYKVEGISKNLKSIRLIIDFYSECPNLVVYGWQEKVSVRDI